jgi:hypothetical protein
MAALGYLREARKSREQIMDFLFLFSLSCITSGILCDHTFDMVALGRPEMLPWYFLR